MKMWTEFLWHRIRTSSGELWKRKATVTFHKIWRIS